MLATAVIFAVLISGAFVINRFMNRPKPSGMTGRSERAAPPAAVAKREQFRSVKIAPRDTARTIIQRANTIADHAVKKQSPMQRETDSLQALADSFNLLSPEQREAGASNQNASMRATPPAPLAKEKKSTPADSGRLFIYSDPWATVFVDGREIGTTPFEDPVSLPAGVHAITLTNNTCAPLLDTVTLPADSLLKKRYRLEARE